MRLISLKTLITASVAAVGLAVAPLAQASASPQAGASAAQAAGSGSGLSQPTLVGTVPGANTPNVADGTVEAITQVGSEIIVGGTFTSVTAPGSTANPVTRDYLFGFDATTGAISTTFVPQLDAGPVEGLAPGPQPNTVYVAGSFNTVNGTKSKSVALISTLTGQLVSGWAPAVVNGAGWTVKLSGGHLFLGGVFATVGGVAHAGLVSLDPNTGALQPYVTVQVAGHHNYTGQPGQSDAPVGVHRMDVSPDGTRLVAVGNFKTVDGVTHDQIMMVDLGATTADVDPNWNTSGYTATCASNAYDTYMRDIAFSPDGSYFAVAATGGGTFDQNTDGSRALCDTVTRWSTTDTGTDVQPTWIDYTGNDSFESIATSGTAIYLGGHERWVNNSAGSDSPGEGSVPRPGLAAVNPVNGLPYSWNPGRNPRGAGAYALLLTAGGLYVGSDTTYIGNHQYYRGRLAYFPLAGGENVTVPGPVALPANVYLAGQIPTSTNTNVLYRVDAGGPAIQAIDNGPVWQADDSDPSPYRNSGSSTASYSPITQVSSSVPATTPLGIYSTERWDPGSQGDGQEMDWSFPVTPGLPIQVRLYFANNYSGTSQVGQRVFDVALDGTTVLDHYDIVADTGNLTGTMKSFNITSPASGQVTIDFTHEVENPLINGIEIVRTDEAPPTSTQFDTVTDRSFDGTTAGTTTTLPDPGGITWSQVRGAFLVGDTLFYGYSDGNFYERSFDGQSFGPATLVDPYQDPAWDNVQTGSGQTYEGTLPNLYGAEMQNVTGMVYSDGKLYYSLVGQTALDWRYFNPDDGVIGSQEFQAGGSDDFSSIDGMFLSGNTLYYAAASTGNLHSVAFDNGSPDATTDTVVSGPSVDGNDWRARGMFLDTPSAPTAAFTPTCTQLACSFDASASTAPGSTITSYAWNFGDGATGSGQTPAHTYSSAGTYPVSLTVTNASNQTATTTEQVSVVANSQPIAFVGQSETNGNATTETVNVPAGTATGNAMLLLAASNAAVPMTAPAGWTQVDTIAGSISTTTVWSKVATSGDLGGSVAVGFGGVVHGTVQLLTYSGTDPVTPVVASGKLATTKSSSSETTPVVTAPGNGDFAISYWTAKSSAVTAWTAPASQTVRSADNGSGSGRINSLVTDTGGPVSAGQAGGVTATTDQPASASTAWTIILAPAS
jgi:PKD repeat protein